jgi:hypothetical protein
LGFAFTVIGGAFLLLSLLSLVIPVLRSYGFAFELMTNGRPGMPLLALALVLVGIVLRKRAPAPGVKAPAK